MLLGVIEALDGGSPHLALEHLHAALRIGGDRDDSLLDPDPPPAAPADGPDDDRAAAVDVAVE